MNTIYSSFSGILTKDHSKIETNWKTKSRLTQNNMALNCSGSDVGKAPTHTPGIGMKTVCQCLMSLKGQRAQVFCVLK